MFNILMKKQALRAITHFCAKDDIRYYLNGALVEVSDNGRACLVGTNGHSLGMIDLGETNPGAVAGQYILPRSAFEKMPKPRRHDTSWLNLAGADMVVVVMPRRSAEPNGQAAELMGRFTCKIWADAEFCPVPPAMQRAADEHVQCAPEVAQWLDPEGKLQAAGLMRVAA